MNFILGILAVPVVLLLIAAAVPVWLFMGLTGLGRTTSLSREQVLEYIDDFVAGTGGDWDWDDFISIPISDSQLESVRQECRAATFPPTGNRAYELAELGRIAARLREELPNKPLQPTSGTKTEIE